MRRLEGKNAIVTGANGGIGNAVVHKFAEEGANVWAFVRNKSEEFENEIVHLGEQNNIWIKPVYCDISSQEAIKLAFSSIYKSHRDIDILANIAGISQNSTFMMTSMKEFQHIFDVNFFGAVYLTQLVLKRMIKSGGSIINMSSWSAEGTSQTESAYGASKAALVAFTRHLAAEMGRYNIRANAIEPGAIETDMIKNLDGVDRYYINRSALGRVGKAEEIADLVCYLASDESSYVNGVSIPVTGGGVEKNE